jgi:hypothetical protein
MQAHSGLLVEQVGSCRIKWDHAGLSRIMHDYHAGSLVDHAGSCRIMQDNAGEYKRMLVNTGGLREYCGLYS